MSTEVRAEDEHILRESVNIVRSQDSPVESYVLVNHAGGSINTIELGHQGAGVEDLAMRLDECQVQYALVKLQETIDMSTTVKFVYIHWIGEKVPMVKKGRYGVVHGSVREQFFKPSHADVETSALDDISMEAFMKMISETSGTKSMVLENSEAETRQKRGFTSVPTTQVAKAKGPLIPVSSEGASVKHGQDVIDAISDVRSDDSETVWACIGYEGNDVKKPLQMIAKGSEGLDVLKEYLDEDKPLYFLYRTTDVVDGHTTVKFVYIIWVGEKVKPMAKAKLSTHKGVVQEIFSGSHVTIFATNRNEITLTIIKDKVQSASGTKSCVK